MKTKVFSALALASIMFMGCSNNDDPVVIKSANDYFREVSAQATQTFNLNTSELPKAVTLKGGTKITIKNGTFTKGGTPISGAFTLEVREYLKPSDIVRGGVNTNHRNGSPLVSDGFFYINAKQGGVDVDKKLARNLLIEIPKEVNRYYTQLWEGIENAGDGENQFAWDDLPDDAVGPGLDSAVMQDGNWIGADQGTAGSVTFIFNLGKLGWYNCDIYWEFPNGQTTVYVKITGFAGSIASYQGYSGEIFVFFCGKGDKVISQLYSPYYDGSNVLQGAQSYVNSMPLGKIGKLIAFAIKEGEFYFAAQDNVTITANMELTLNLQATTEETIQAEFNKLDNFK
jgi:hypothetical protein